MLKDTDFELEKGLDMEMRGIVLLKDLLNKQPQLGWFIDLFKMIKRDVNCCDREEVLHMEIFTLACKLWIIWKLVS